MAEHAEEIDLNDEEEAALDRAWDKIEKEGFADKSINPKPKSIKPKDPWEGIVPKAKKK